MLIHVVLPGETAYSIADYYGISSTWLIRENEIKEPNNLVVGNALLILYPVIIHTIEEGDTLEDIATMYNVTSLELLRNNSYLAVQEKLIVGDTIVVQYKNNRTRYLSVFRYCYPTIDEAILRRNLPYLTYLIIYSYVIESSELFGDIDVSNILEASRTYSVGTIMQISFANEEGMAETNLAHDMLNDKDISRILMEDILNTLSEKGYSGIGISPIYIYPSDRELYKDFFEELIIRVQAMGLIVIDTIVPETFELVTDIFDAQYYIRFINELANSTIVYPISVGIRLNMPMGTSNYNAIEHMIEYFLKYIPPEMLKLGINTVGYIWDLPYIPCVSEGNAISVSSIMQMARDYNIPISFDEGTQAAYFVFQDNNSEYLIRFRDTRSFITYLDVVETFNLDGIGVWNTLSFITPLWLIVNVSYYINKVDI